MQVHLIKTLDYPAEDFDEVIDILRSFPGPAKFYASDYEFHKGDFRFLTRGMDSRWGDAGKPDKQVYALTEPMPLSWMEFFSLCKIYREAMNVPPGDMVILLTERPNPMNWFSMTDGEKNAFVHGADWQKFTQTPAQYPIAYEVMANVLRALTKIEFPEDDENLHEHPIGCMNDLCLKKKDILLKLRTADICDKCREKMRQAAVPDELVQQAFELFDGIRKQMLFRASGKQQIKPYPITLSANRRLLFPDLGNLHLRLTPLEMTLYVFYLLHPEGVRLNELNDHQAELLSLYQKFAVHDSNEEIAKRIKSLVDPFSNSFSEKKSALNRKIKKLLGVELGVHYTIKGEPGSPFCIGLNEGLIRIEEREA